MEEQRIRTIAKTISWRVIATFATMLIVYLYTREMVLTIGVGVIEVIAKMMLYYAHERLWSKSRWGMKYHLSFLVSRTSIPEWMGRYQGSNAATPIWQR